MYPSLPTSFLLSLCLIGLGFLPPPAVADDNDEGAPLQGHLQQNAKTKATKEPALKPMVPITDMNQPGNSAEDQAGETSVDHSLDGQAQSTSAGDMFAPHSDLPSGQPQNMLKGYASLEDIGNAEAADPDADDQELLIAWDRWRNRFLRAVQLGMQETLNNLSEGNLRWDQRLQTMVSRYPMGTESWFYCQITPDLKIVHLKIIHSSGIRSYDQAVMSAVDALQGSSILRYPPRSKRQVVVQVAGIKTAETSEFHFFKFGDVERQMVPGQ
jgi:hypothetical protein